jgi:peptidoglycan-associated lipoprotein
MPIQRICGLSILLAALALSGGCSTLNTRGPAPTPDSGTTAFSSGADAPVHVIRLAPLAEEDQLEVRHAPAALRSGKPDPAAAARLVHFDYDSAAISAADQALLDRHASHLRSAPDRSVRLEGHADARGTRAYNLALGERRARAVAAYLLARGVAERVLEVISFGEARPVADGDDEAALQRNRRVEIVYR